jgi:hypothetical protein
MVESGAKKKTTGAIEGAQQSAGGKLREFAGEGAQERPRGGGK